MDVIGYGTMGEDKKFEPMKFERQELRAGEVAFRVTHCGVCHSDLHQARNDWGNTNYPCVPGHEVVGTVTGVGEGVKNFKEGDTVGVGCMINSCQQCDPCKNDLEQFCEGPKSCTLTYNGTKDPDGSNTYGGYSTDMIVREEFMLEIPKDIDPKYAGPIMCAGITVYSPMKHWKLEKGQHLGVAGIGGLGHMAIKIGKAMGAKVTAFTRSEDKKQKILDMGADEVVISKNDDEMEKAAQSLDMMINTIPVAHDINPYVNLMKPNSALIVVGNMMGFENVESGPLVFNRITLAGSLIGGIKETQEVLDLCAKHDIKPDVKMIKIEEIDSVYDTLADGNDGDFRHVIDMETLRNLDDDKKNSAKEIDPPNRGEVVH